MNRFQNILFVSHGVGDETDAMRLAVRLARDNSARLAVLVVYPGLPHSLREHQELYETTLAAHLQGSLQSVRTEIAGATSSNGQVPVDFERGSGPAIRIVQRVLRDRYDLVIKAAEPGGERKGFRAMDMDLLRKCPCPVWFCRPLDRTNQHPYIAVAVDPINEEPAGRKLAIDLLQLAHQLTQRFGGELSIISCWNYAYEEYLRDRAFPPITAAALQKAAREEQLAHKAALDALLNESGMGSSYLLYHMNGKPEQIIPALTDQKHIDILVMGTVARTGIPGFIIGNTAENILRELSCSLLALKPDGFVSPVTVSGTERF